MVRFLLLICVFLLVANDVWAVCANFNDRALYRERMAEMLNQDAGFLRDAAKEPGNENYKTGLERRAQRNDVLAGKLKNESAPMWRDAAQKALSDAPVEKAGVRVDYCDADVAMAGAEPPWQSVSVLHRSYSIEWLLWFEDYYLRSLEGFKPARDELLVMMDMTNNLLALISEAMRLKSDSRTWKTASDKWKKDGATKDGFVTTETRLFLDERAQTAVLTQSDTDNLRQKIWHDNQVLHSMRDRYETDGLVSLIPAIDAVIARSTQALNLVDESTQYYANLDLELQIYNPRYRPTTPPDEIPTAEGMPVVDPGAPEAHDEELIVLALKSADQMNMLAERIEAVVKDAGEVYNAFFQAVERDPADSLYPYEDPLADISIVDRDGPGIGVSDSIPTGAGAFGDSAWTPILPDAGFGFPKIDKPPDPRAVHKRKTTVFNLWPPPNYVSGSGGGTFVGGTPSDGTVPKYGIVEAIIMGDARVDDTFDLANAEAAFAEALAAENMLVWGDENSDLDVRVYVHTATAPSDPISGLAEAEFEFVVVVPGTETVVYDKLISKTAEVRQFALAHPFIGGDPTLAEAIDAVYADAIEDLKQVRAE